MPGSPQLFQGPRDRVKHIQVDKIHGLTLILPCLQISPWLASGIDDLPPAESTRLRRSHLWACVVNSFGNPSNAGRTNRKKGFPLTASTALFAGARLRDQWELLQTMPKLWTDSSHQLLCPNVPSSWDGVAQQVLHDWLVWLRSAPVILPCFREWPSATVAFPSFPASLNICKLQAYGRIYIYMYLFKYVYIYV